MWWDVLELQEKSKGSFQQDLRDKILSYLHHYNPLEEALSKAELQQHFICFWVTSKHQTNIEGVVLGHLQGLFLKHSFHNSDQ